ncbi:ATP-dependent zinc metalloprotease FtsH [Georgenia yuyongxinii]|nr:ATP-dependent zinc metalloprotease FtsH [Georgenia yuyongxinii]
MWPRWALPFGVVLLLLLSFGPGLLGSQGTEHLSYSTFLSDVRHHDVSSVAVGSQGQVTGVLTSGKDFVTQAPVWALTTTDLSHQLEQAGVHVSAFQQGGSLFQQGGSLAQVVASFLPMLLLIGAMVWMGRRGLASTFRTKAKVSDAERPHTTFDDVAGYDGAKEEVREVVDFLQHPDRYLETGARGPRGVLLVGPPGTGKTLLARAVAGEANVPFYAATGSSFVEIFAGLGASRVRDLFAQARASAPAIVFIDEIDAIGGRRGVAGIAGNDEREQTLNQLLAEMDGFTQNTSVVVLANTNRPEILDPALLRPGRFDRQVTVPLPALADRERILAVHTRDKHLSADVDLHALARGTPGFSGADLANLVNEAALRAARANRRTIRAADFDAARDRLILGRPETSALLPDERRRVAVHESGHAVVAALSPTADPVAKITILPAGTALGATHQLPVDERRLYSEQYLTDLLTVRLAGRAAELVVLGQASTGAADDLAGATQLAQRMVLEYGLSRLGPVAYPPSPTSRLDGGPDRPYADDTQRRVDAEVTRLLNEADERAAALLAGHRSALDKVTHLLLETETVDGAIVYDILHRVATGSPEGPVPSGFAAWLADPSSDTHPFRDTTSRRIQ